MSYIQESRYSSKATRPATTCSQSKLHIMKHAFLFLFVAALVSCNAPEDKTAKDEPKVAGAADTSSTRIDYAYTIEHPDQWVTGSRENTKMVLASLKKWEMGDFDGALENFGDSVQLNFDRWESKMPRDSVKAMFAAERKNYKSMQIIMDDFESVKSKDGTKEYVSLWYKQKSQDNKGTWDSVSVMDDLLIRNGKIVSIDEKLRHYPVKKN